MLKTISMCGCTGCSSCPTPTSIASEQCQPSSSSRPQRRHSSFLSEFCVVFILVGNYKSFGWKYDGGLASISHRLYSLIRLSDAKGVSPCAHSRGCDDSSARPGFQWYAWFGSPGAHTAFWRVGCPGPRSRNTFPGRYLLPAVRHGQAAPPPPRAPARPGQPPGWRCRTRRAELPTAKSLAAIAG